MHDTCFDQSAKLKRECLRLAKIIKGTYIWPRKMTEDANFIFTGAGSRC